MPDQRWRHGRHGGHPPRWWPEGETWPPADARRAEEWRGGFMWRIGCFFAFMAILLVGFFAVLSWLIGTVLGGSDALGPAVVIGLVLLILLALGGTAFRRAAAPVGDLIEASGRVEAGDFSTRVSEVGPREVRALARAFNAMSARLEATEQTRRSALADVSHELRTPLAVIQGNLEALIDGVYPADAEHLEPILEETRVLERLVEDLRTLTLVEAGSLVLHREPTEIGSLLGEIAAGFRNQAAAAGITLAVNAADGLPPLDVDPARIREVVANLLTNAMRHTPAGGTVETSVRLKDAEVVVSVSDTGSGMTPEQLDRIFERFYRSPGSPGSGLGLSIARSLVEAHGGTMAATSRPGVGTTMEFRLPAPTAGAGSD